MQVKFERRIGSRSPAALVNQLNEDQKFALQQLENFGWELKFVRRVPFQPLCPVVFDGDRKKFAVLKEDGSLDEHPKFEIRH